MTGGRLFARALFVTVAMLAVVGIAMVLLAEDTEAVTTISLSIQGSDTQSVLPGGGATFKINVTNLLTTTTLTVNLTYSTAPTYWTAQLSQTSVSVTPLATKVVTLSVGVPANATADSVGRQIIVTADPDFGDTEQITTTTKVSQTYGIQTSTATASKHTVGGSTVTFIMNVNNTGNGQDTVSITHSGQPSTWTVSHVSSVTVPAGSSRTVTITVVPASTASSGTYQTTVKATSIDGTKSDQTTFIIIIDPVYGLTLSSSDVSKYVTPNQPAYYNLSVTNTGNTADNAAISKSNVPSGWTVLPTSNPVFLSPNETKVFQILVTAPTTALAGTQVQITISATSGGNSSIVRQLSINSVVNQIYDPRVTPQTNSKIIPPGSAGTFKIDVSNQGNGNDTVDLSLSGVPTGQGWIYNFNPVSVALTPGQTKTVNLTFGIGSKAAYGDSLITVMGTSHGTSKKGSTSVVVSVSQFYNMALVPVGASTQRVDPGGSVHFNFSVTNTGNGPDDFTFSVVNMQSSWVSYFSRSTVYNLPANGTEMTMLTVEIPTTTNSGTYRFDVKAVSDGNASVTRTILDLTIIVNQLYAVSIDPAYQYINGDPLTTVTLDLTVTNDGSGMDNFTISAPGTYASWIVFNRTTVALNPSASTIVRASITPPTGTVAGNVMLAFRATSKGRATVYDESTVTFTVNKYYKPTLTAVESQIHKKPTETAVFTVQLKNTGNDADTFKVNFTQNTKSLASYSLSSPFVSLGVGATRTFSVTVTVPAGEPVGNLRYVLLATSENDTASSATVALTVIVDPVYGVNIYSYDANASCQPTDSDSVELRIANTGNGQDTYTLKATGAYYKWATFAPGSVTVAKGAEAVANVTVTPPDGTAIGTYRIDVVATSSSDTNVKKTIAVMVTVEHKEDVEVTAANLVRRKTVDPGSSATFSVKVANTGLDRHVINLVITGSNAAWAKMNRSELILDGGASGLVTVTVSVPEGTVPMTFDLDVTGTMDDMTTRTDTLVITTVVRTVRYVKVELNDTTISREPGTTATVTLSVTNTGNAQDTFDLSVDVDKGYVVFSPASITLAAGAKGNVTVRVTAPTDPLTPTGLHRINVTATSQANASVRASALLEFMVDQVYGVTLKASPQRKAVDPGMSAVYNVTVTNKGNGNDIFILSLDGARKAWGKLSKTQVTVGAGQQVVVQLTVRVPSNQPVEDAIVMVEVTSSGDDNVTALVTTTTVINPFFGVDMTVSNPNKPGFPGRYVVFQVKVKNTGNSQDTFRFDVEGDYASWVAVTVPMVIDAGKTKTLEVNITPPSDVANGQYIFTINGSSETKGDVFDTLELKVTINVFYRMDVTISASEMDSRPGVTEKALVHVENLGNVDDVYNLRVLGSYTNWVTLDNVTLNVDDGATGTSTATILVNATLSGDYRIRFEVTSEGGGNVTEVQVTIKILLTYGVSMTPSRDEFPGGPDTSVLVEVEIANTGNIEDTFDLSLPQLPGSLWNASLEFPRITLPGGDTGYFNVTVDVPAGVAAGMYQVKVRATSTRSPLPSPPTRTLNLNITIDYGVSITGPEGIISLLPGATGTVEVFVKNEGLGRDGFLLAVLPPYSEWAALVGSSLTLGPGQMGTMEVTLTPPGDIKTGTYIVEVKATSASDGSVYDVAEITVRVTQVYGVMIEPATLLVSGEAGEYLFTEITVTNTGNGADTINLVAMVGGGAPIQVGFPDGTSLNIDAGKSVQVTVRLIADKDTEAGSFLVTVTARSSTYTPATDTMAITFEVAPIISVDLKTDTGDDQVFIFDAVVGRDYQFSVEVFNTGNVEDDYGITVVSDDSGLPSWFTLPPGDVTVGASKSKMLLITVSIPYTALAGQYIFAVQAKSLSENVSALLDGRLEVEADHSVYLSSDTTESSVDPSGGTGGGARFVLTVHNDGNVQESVSFSVGYPSAWGPPVLTPQTVLVSPLDTAEVVLEFMPSSVPSNAPAVNAVTVLAKYSQRESSILSLSVRVLKSDVRVSTVSLSDYNPKDGDSVDVTVTLSNTGDVDAKGLTVTLLVNDVEMVEVTGQSVLAKGQRDVSFSWVVDETPGSTLVLKVRVPQADLTHTVPEQVIVQEDEKDLMAQIEALGMFVLIGMGLLLGLLLGILLLVAIGKGHRRKVEAAHATGVAEGLRLADSEPKKEEVPEEETEGDEEADGDEGEADEEEVEEGPEEEEDVTPVTVQCPKCDTLNVVTTAQRPYEFRCEKCNRLLRLSR